MSRPRLIALLLALVTLVIYLPVTHYDFLTYDDGDYVTGNPMVKQGLTLAGLRWAFTTFHASNWHPLTWLSHMADCSLFGMNAGAQHFVNVLFHAANAALLFVLLWRLTKKIWPSALVAALFAWHPLHVESVAWISERKDVLSTFFALLALLSYAKFVEHAEIKSPKSKQFYAASVGLFALGLMAKPMLVTLPFVLLLLDYWPLQRFPLSAFRFSLLSEKIPFFLLSAISCVVTCIAQKAAMHTLGQLPLSFRMENAAVTVAHYLLELFCPVDLAVYYPLARISGATIALAVAALVLVSAAVWRARRRSPCWLVGWLWFLGTLVPVMGLVQVGTAAMADRYTYLPSVGIFLACVFGLGELGGRVAAAKKIAPFIALLLILCVAGTERQLNYWRDTETLFRHALAATKDNDIAHANLGVLFDQQGRTAEALAEYREAVRLNPAHRELHFGIGNMLAKMNQPAEALAEYRLCLRLDPQIPALHGAAGCALATLGKDAEALQEFAEAGRLDPHYALPRIETAKIFFRQGRAREAVAELHAALRADPDDFQTLATVAHYLAASENAGLRDGPTALKLALEANEASDGSQPVVLDILGMAYAANGDFTNAVAAAQNALQLATAAGLTEVAAISNRLVLYQNRQPWRESFGDTNAPAEP